MLREMSMVVRKIGWSFRGDKIPGRDVCKGSVVAMAPCFQVALPFKLRFSTMPSICNDVAEFYNVVFHTREACIKESMMTAQWHEVYQR